VVKILSESLIIVCQYLTYLSHIRVCSQDIFPVHVRTCLSLQHKTSWGGFTVS
jgi:hypothetical protein